jgi:hypothetical protein
MIILQNIENVAYLEGIFNTWNSKTKQLIKIQWVQQITISSKILRPHLLLIYTKFPCQHAAVISRFTPSSPLLHNIFTHGRWWRHAIPISVTSWHPLTSRTSRLFLNIWSLDMQKSSIYSQFDKLRNFSSWRSSVNRRTNC